MKEIPLNHGMVALVDDADYEWLMQWKWCAMAQKSNKGLTYAARWERGNRKSRKCIQMHQALIAAPKGYVIDHINRNGLDNQRHNLRVCTQAENSRNARPYGKTSRYKGVSLKKNMTRFQAYICVNARRIHLGYFRSEIDAALAYDTAAREHFGEFAYLNFPNEKLA